MVCPGCGCMPVMTVSTPTGYTLAPFSVALAGASNARTAAKQIAKYEKRVCFLCKVDFIWNFILSGISARLPV